MTDTDAVCSACDRPTIALMIMRHRGKEWGVCRECYFASAAKPIGKMERKKK